MSSSAPGAQAHSLVLPDPESAGDLATFVGRAKRLDPEGAARLVGHGRVLAVYVSPLHGNSLTGAGLPTVLGLRTLALAEPSDVDVVVPLAALTDRLARHPAPPGTATDATVVLAVPPVEVLDAAWAGVSPPRQGWQALGVVDGAALAAAARDGIAEVSAGTPRGVGGIPQGAGGAAVERLRAGVWGRPVPDLAGTPAGAAFAADALGFLSPREPVALYACGRWRRLTTSRGHILART